MLLNLKKQSFKVIPKKKQIIKKQFNSKKLRRSKSKSKTSTHKFQSTINNIVSIIDTTKTYTFSPLSLFMALMILYNGLTGSNSKEIKKVLRLPNIYNINKTCKTFSTELNSLKSVLIANSIWGRQEIRFRKPYVRLVKKNFNTKPKIFSDIQEINLWCAKKTNNLITEIIDPDNTDMDICLVNAIYFKDTWTIQFDKKLTKKRQFHIVNNSTKTKSIGVMMMSTKNKFNYFNNGSYQFIKLDYMESGVFAIVALPTNKTSLRFDYDWEMILDRLDRPDEYKEEIHFKMPKFEISSTHKLIPSLKKIGIKSIFDTLDLSKMIENKTKYPISNIIQKVVVKVDEKGTEASAVTDIERGKGPNNNKIEMVCDHPFEFIISNKRGLQLFKCLINNKDVFY